MALSDAYEAVVVLAPGDKLGMVVQTSSLVDIGPRVKTVSPDGRVGMQTRIAAGHQLLSVNGQECRGFDSAMSLLVAAEGRTVLKLQTGSSDWVVEGDPPRHVPPGGPAVGKVAATDCHIFDGKGPDGNRGRDGRSGCSGAGLGQDGQDGMPATRSTPGDPASDLDVLLGTDRGQGQALQVRCRGSRPFSGSDVHVPIERTGSIVLMSRGGRGGGGANGGHGGNGATGYPGQDATRHSSGGDGGPGGDGGDGAPGTDGSRGGDGGHITVATDTSETYLLMALESMDEPEGLVTPGAGGMAGRHGKGGSGGAGGRGGNPYSWTETVGSGENQHQVPRRNPGGSRGRRGRDGRTPYHPLYNGPDGTPGKVTLRVHSLGTFGRRYALSVAHFGVTASGSAASPWSAGDGIFEFGEFASASGIVLRNRQGADRMPSPAHQRVRLRVRPNPWVIPTGQDSFHKGSIPAGATATAGEPVPFSLNHDVRCGYRPADADTVEGCGYYRQIDVGPDCQPPPVARVGAAPVLAPGADAHADDFDPVVIHAQVCTFATMLGLEDATAHSGGTRFQRDFPEDLTNSITTKFPIQNESGLVGLTSLSVGEMSNLTLAIENISSVTLGRTHGRAVKVQVWGDEPKDDGSGGALCPKDMTLDIVINGTSAGQQSLSYPGYSLEFPTQPTNQIANFQGRFQLSSGASYAGGRIRSALFISDLHEPTGWRLVQRRALSVKCEPSFMPKQLPIQVLLVCSSAVPRAKYLAWVDLTKKLGLSTEVYPITRYGHFDPSERLPFGDKPTLGSMLNDTLVIMLDDPFTSAKMDVKPSWTVAPWHIRATAAQSSPTNYVFVREQDMPRMGAQARSHCRAEAPDTASQASTIQSLWSSQPPNSGVGTGKIREYEVVVPEKVVNGQMLIAIGDAEAVAGTPQQTRLVHVPPDVKAGEKIVVTVALEPELPQTIQLDAMKSLLGRYQTELLPDFNPKTSWGEAGADPYLSQYHVPVLMSSCWHSFLCVFGFKQRAVLSRLLRAARTLERCILRSPHVDATIILVAGDESFDWNASYIEHDVTTPWYGCHGPSPKAFLQEYAVGEKTGTLVGTLKVFLRPSSASRLSVLSINPAAARESLPELATQSVVAALSTCAKFRLLAKAIDDLQGGELMDKPFDVHPLLPSPRLAAFHAVLALLGDASVEMVRAISRRGTLLLSVEETPTWALLAGDADVSAAWRKTSTRAASFTSDQHKAIDGLKGSSLGIRLASALEAMATTPGLAKWYRPFSRPGKACKFFAALAARVASRLQVAADPEIVANYHSQMTHAMSTARNVSDLKPRLWVQKKSRRRGFFAAQGTAKEKTTYAILWRFGSSGIAMCDQVQAVVSDGRDATHVRDVAVLPKVQILTEGGEFGHAGFTNLTQTAHATAIQWKSTLRKFRQETQIGTNKDTGEMMRGLPQPTYEYVPGKGSPPPVVMAVPVAAPVAAFVV